MSNRSIFLRNVLSLFTVCLFAIIIFVLIIFPFITNQFINNKEDNQIALVDKTKASVDEMFTEIYALPSIIKSDTDFKFTRLSSGDILHLIDASKLLSKYTSSNRYISAAFLYVESKNVFLGGGNVYQNELFGDTSFFLDNYSQEELLYYINKSLTGEQIILEESKFSERSEGSFTEVIPMIFPVTTGEVDYKSSLIVYLNKQNVEDVLLQSFNESEVMIIDSNENIILDLEFNNDYSRQIARFVASNENLVLKSLGDVADNLLITSVSSKFNNMRYVIVSDEEFVFEDLVYIRSTYIFSMLLIALFMIIVSFVLAFWNYTPIRTLYKQWGLNSQLDKGIFSDDTKVIDTLITELSENNYNLNQKLITDNIYIRDSVLYRFITGQYKSTDSILERCKQVSIDILGAKYCAVIVHNNNSITNVPNREIELLLKEKNSEILVNFCNPVNNNMIIFLLQYIEDIDIKELTSDLYNNLISENDNNLCFFVGSVCDTIADLNKSYLNIMNNLSRNIKPNGIFYCENVFIENSIENQYLDNLFKWIFTENIEEIENCINIIAELIKTKSMTWEDDFVKSSVNILEEKCMLSNINIKSKISFIQKGNISSSEICNIINSIAKEITSKLSDGFPVSSQILMEEILFYINSHYLDKDFSMSKVSSEFSLSESSFSHMFKKKMNSTFINYINNLKVMQAKHLLITSSKNLNEIAAELCYSTASNFSRMFKSITNMTPAQYRQMHKDKQ